MDENRDANDLAHRLQFVDFTDEDRARVVAIAPIVQRDVDALTNTFFEYLERFPEAHGVTHDRVLVDQARALKRAHLLDSVRGEYGAGYVDQRLALGALYARGHLEPHVFIGAFNHLVREVCLRVTREGIADPLAAHARVESYRKLSAFDVSIIVDVIVAARERTIRAQQKLIAELSTPVLRVREGLLVVPLIGALDDVRATQLTSALLRAIRETRAKAVVIDVTGVPVVDTQVTTHLSRAIQSASLMGARAIVTGVAPAVARAMVDLGVDLKGAVLCADLQEGLESAA